MCFIRNLDTTLDATRNLVSISIPHLHSPRSHLFMNWATIWITRNLAPHLASHAARSEGRHFSDSSRSCEQLKPIKKYELQIISASIGAATIRARSSCGRRLTPSLSYDAASTPASYWTRCQTLPSSGKTKILTRSTKKSWQFFQRMDGFESFFHEQIRVCQPT